MELILRFVALRENFANYKSPMPKFLDNFMEENRELPEDRAAKIGDAFKNAADFVVMAFGKDGLRSDNTFRVLRFDSVMCGFDTYLESHSNPSEKEAAERLVDLEKDDDYNWSIEEFVTETNRVKKRMERVRSIFGA